LGTRPSRLALRQAEEIKSIFAPVEFEIVPYITTGDKDKVTAISDVEGTDFFTRELDEAVLKGEIDLAVHSSKDFPEVSPAGLSVVFESASLSPNDCLVSRSGHLLKDLPAKNRIGTSSRRRKEQIRALRADLIAVDIRGDIDERLSLVDAGKIDAVIVAHAALIRLGLEHRIAEILNLEDFPTHPRQGKLLLTVKRDRWQEVKYILSAPGQATGS
jgi:hydroxymethylbilane synthase